MRHYLRQNCNEPGMMVHTFTFTTQGQVDLYWIYIMSCRLPRITS